MRAYFVEQGYGEIIAFGQSRLTEQLNQLPSPDRAGRVVIVPHDETGKAGKLAAAREIGSRPRQVYGIDHTVEIHCWGRNTTASRSDEGAHYDVAFDLYEAAMCAVRDAAVGRVAFDELRQLVDLKTAFFGVVLVQKLVLQGGLFDPDVVQVPPPIGVEVTDNAMVFPSGDVAD